MRTVTRWILGAAAAALVVAIVVMLDGGDVERTPSWSEEPFPVAGWFVNLSEPEPCAARVEHDYPDWTVSSCRWTHSFTDGISRMEFVGDPEADPEVMVDDLGDDDLAPNPWFAPIFHRWSLEPTPAGDLMLHPRELSYGGADVMGVDADGVPVLYVQRNQYGLEYVQVFVRDDATRAFPSSGEIAAALELAGLPDDLLAGSLVDADRIEHLRRRLSP